jgi:ribosome-binding protein aMBF1 (putative translation factor)
MNDIVRLLLELDPQERLKAMQAHEQFNQRYGGAIRALRQSRGLRQQAIVGLDERSVRRIEQGKSRATSNALDKLAKAHGMAMGEYMAAVAGLLGG